MRLDAATESALAAGWLWVERRYRSRLRDEAQDLAQEAGMAALLYADRPHGDEHDFRHLMLRIAKCQYVDLCRRRALFPAAPLERLAELAVRAGYDVELENRDFIARLPIAAKYRPALSRWMRDEHDHGRKSDGKDRKYVFRAIRTCRAYVRGEKLTVA